MGGFGRSGRPAAWGAGPLSRGGAGQREGSACPGGAHPARQPSPGRERGCVATLTGRRATDRRSWNEGGGPAPHHPEQSCAMSLFDLTGKVALITGSSRGIGRAIALRMAEHGARVVISSRKREACAAVVAEIEAAHGAGPRGGDPGEHLGEGGAGGAGRRDREPAECVSLTLTTYTSHQVATITSHRSQGSSSNHRSMDNEAISSGDIDSLQTPGILHGHVQGRILLLSHRIHKSMGLGKTTVGNKHHSSTYTGKLPLPHSQLPWLPRPSLVVCAP